MKLRLHHQFLIGSLLLIAIAVGSLDLILSNSLRRYMENHVERQLLQATSLASAYLDGAAGRETPSQSARRIAEALDLRATIIAEDGTVVGESEVEPGELGQIENHGNRPEVRQAAQEGIGRAVRYSTTVRANYMYVARRDARGYVRLAVPLTHIEDLLGELRLRLLLATLAAVSLALLFSFVAARRISRPIREIALGASRLATGGLSQRLDVGGGEEIGALGSAINTMAETLQAKMLELSEGKRRLEQILAAMGQGVMVVGGDGRIVLANPSMGEVAGTVESLNGRLPREVLPDPAFAEAVARVFQNRRLETMEIQEGSGRKLQAHLTPVEGEGASLGAVVIVFNDITEIRRTEQMRRDFVANVSHEFKTPLTSIRGYTETLLGGAGEDVKWRANFLGVIDRNARFLEALVRDLLVLAKLEAELPTRREAVEIAELIEELLSARRAAIEERKIRVVVDSPRIYLQADRSRLTAAVSNLIDNAVNYNRTGGEVRIRARQENGRSLLLSIEDTGIGIPPEDVSRVFERFYRVDKARSRESGGTGLGLAIARHAVESQGGRITVESKLGQGSIFTILL